MEETVRLRTPGSQREQRQASTGPVAVLRGIGDKIRTAVASNEAKFDGFPVAGTSFVKVGSDSSVYVVRCLEEGLLEEVQVMDPANRWEGQWAVWDSGHLLFDIGGYHLVAAAVKDPNGAYPAKASHEGVEYGDYRLFPIAN